MFNDLTDLVGAPNRKARVPDSTKPTVVSVLSLKHAIILREAPRSGGREDQRSARPQMPLAGWRFSSIAPACSRASSSRGSMLADISLISMTSISTCCERSPVSRHRRSSPTRDNAIREYEKAGTAAVEATVSTRSDPDFLTIARTEALTSRAIILTNLGPGKHYRKMTRPMTPSA